MKTCLTLATLNVLLLFYGPIQKVTSRELTLEGSISDILSEGNNNIDIRKLIIDLLHNELKPVRDEYQNFNANRIKMSLDISKQKENSDREMHKILAELKNINKKLSSTIEKQHKAISELRTELTKELQLCSDRCQNTSISISKLENKLQTFLEENEEPNLDISLLKNESRTWIEIPNIFSLPDVLDVSNKSDLQVSELEREFESADVSINSNSNGKLETVITCEHYQAALECTVPGKTIRIISANYGRTESGYKVCSQYGIETSNCISEDSKNKVIAICEGKPDCAVEASNSVFGDPCVGTYKYLEIQFSCI